MPNNYATVSRTGLATAITTVLAVVEKRNIDPILSNVAIFRAPRGGLTVAATDLDMEVTAFVPGAVDDGFAVTVPAHLLADMLKKAPKAERLTLTEPAFVPSKNGYENGSNMVAFALESARYKMRGIPVGDFPRLQPGAMSHRFSTQTSEFLELINGTRGAMSYEETRYYLNGIFLHAVEAGGALTLRAVATDGHRMYRQDTAAPKGSAGMPGIIIPHKTVEFVRALLKRKGAPETIEIETSETMLTVNIGGIATIASKVIDGSFPDYQRATPTGNKGRAVVDAENILDGVKAATAVSSERDGGVKLSFRQGSVTISVNDTDTGSAEVDVPCEFSHPSGPMEIGFNAKYLSEIIAEAIGGGEAVEMQLDDAVSPVVFTGGRHGWLGVLMPMRT